jgi:hypothetical protein
MQSESAEGVGMCIDQATRLFSIGHRLLARHLLQRVPCLGLGKELLTGGTQEVK